MSKPVEVAALIRETQERLGGVDVVVNNAGIQKVAPIEEFPLQSWDAILAINLSSAFHTIRTAVPYMKERRWGRIVNVASAHALVASPFKSAYVAAKHGMLGLTKVVALELAEFGITCNAVCPGYVRTPLVEGQIKDTAKARGISRGGGDPRCDARGTAHEEVRDGGGAGRAHRLPVQRRGSLHHRDGAAGGRRLDRPLAQSDSP